MKFAKYVLLYPYHIMPLRSIVCLFLCHTYNALLAANIVINRRELNEELVPEWRAKYLNYKVNHLLNICCPRSCFLISNLARKEENQGNPESLAKSESHSNSTPRYLYRHSVSTASSQYFHLGQSLPLGL